VPFWNTTYNEYQKAQQFVSVVLSSSMHG